MTLPFTSIFGASNAELRCFSWSRRQPFRMSVGVVTESFALEPARTNSHTLLTGERARRRSTFMPQRRRPPRDAPDASPVGRCGQRAITLVVHEILDLHGRQVPGEVPPSLPAVGGHEDAGIAADEDALR